MNDLPLPLKSCAGSLTLTNSHFICIDLRKSAKSAGNIISVPHILLIIAALNRMLLKITWKHEKSNQGNKC
jgi:hypothetical protein